MIFNSYAKHAVADNIVIYQGPGGCGKSTVMKELWAKDPKHTLCLAPTGIAAQRLRDDGCPALTIHSAFNLPPVTIPFFKENDYIRNKALMDATNLILVDEISMVSCALMDWLLAMVCISFEHGHMVKLALFGDVMQLPPVFRVPQNIEEYRTRMYGTNRFFFNAIGFSGMHPSTHFMEKIFRQNDSEFIDVLSRVRFGKECKSDLNVLGCRVMSRDSFMEQQGSDTFLTLVSTNRERDEINEKEMAKKNLERNDGITYVAEIIGENNQDTLSRVPGTVTLHIGEQVVCTSNSESYKNGTIGKIVDFTDDEIHLPIILTGSGNEMIVGYKATRTLAPVIKDDSISYVETGSVSQVACQCAYAVTVHRAQGLTLDSAYIVLGNWIAESAVYVALSRCRSMDNIGLSRAIRHSDIRIDQEALGFFKRFG